MATKIYWFSGPPEIDEHLPALADKCGQMFAPDDFYRRGYLPDQPLAMLIHLEGRKLIGLPVINEQGERGISFVYYTDRPIDDGSHRHHRIP